MKRWGLFEAKTDRLVEGGFSSQHAALMVKVMDYTGEALNIYPVCGWHPTQRFGKCRTCRSGEEGMQ